MLANKNLSPINNLPIPTELIERRIYLIRGQKVMLDADLAELYQVATKNFNKAVKRNLERFPQDFMFQLNEAEFKNLRFQIGTSSLGHGGRRYLPYVFTEHGIAMLSAVLNSERAVLMSILIIRTFIKMRDYLLNHKDLASRIEKLEAKQTHQGSLIALVVDEISKLKTAPPEPLKKRIGFRDPE